MEGDPAALRPGMSDALRSHIEGLKGGIKPPPPPYGLPDLLSRLRLWLWIPSEEDVHLIMRMLGGTSRESALDYMGMYTSTRSTIETYLGLDVGDDRAIGRLYGRLQVDFGIGSIEADRLLPVHLVRLLILRARRKDSTGAAVRAVLCQAAELKRLEESTPIDADSTPIFLKALSVFPDPEPLEADAAGRPAPGVGNPPHSARDGLSPDESPDHATPDRAARVEAGDTKAKGKALKEPSAKAFQCYRLKVITGTEKSQASIGREVHGKAGMQWKVSRDLRDVAAWIEAGNVLPDLNGTKPKTYATDPSRLDMGRRQDTGRRSDE